MLSVTGKEIQDPYRMSISLYGLNVEPLHLL